MSPSKVATLGMLLALLAPSQARKLTVAAPAEEGLQVQSDEGWIDGRATWYEHPWTGSCGYGKLDAYQFGVDAVAAMPDVSSDYNTSCGRCYEVRCRGIQAISADGSVNLDRHDACYTTTKSIVIKVVDTCPCVGNEKWCCDSNAHHLDLSAGAFSKLAPQGKGIIGLRIRPVPCSMAASSGELSHQEWSNMNQSIALGADTSVFVAGELGLGWKKTVYGDSKRAMYTYDSSVVQFSDKTEALCGEFERYGGFDFHTQSTQVEVFAGSKGVEFWVQTQAGMPDMVFRLGNIQGGGCRKEHPIADYATGDIEAGWTRVFFTLEDFDCTQEVKPENVNRVQWESKNGATSICVKDVKILRD